MIQYIRNSLKLYALQEVDQFWGSGVIGCIDIFFELN